VRRFGGSCRRKYTGREGGPVYAARRRNDCMIMRRIAGLEVSFHAAPAPHIGLLGLTSRFHYHLSLYHPATNPSATRCACGTW